MPSRSKRFVQQGANRRHDEVGTPLCVTVDFQTIEKDDTVTIRNRDTMAQERIKVSDLANYVNQFMRS